MLVLAHRRRGELRGAGRDRARSRARRSGRAISPATRSIAAAIFSAIPYKTPWNLLPFYVGAIVARRDRVLAARRTRPRRARSAACSRPALVVGVGAPRMAGVARVGDLRAPTRATRTSTRRRSPTPSAWRRASASWPPCIRTARACRSRSSRRRTSSGRCPGTCARCRTSATGRRRATRWRCRRRSSSPSMDRRAGARCRARRSLRVRVLRPPARGAAGALRRARAVGRFLCPGRARRRRPAPGCARAPAPPAAFRHCGRAPAVALWPTASARDAPRTGSGRAVLQRGGPPRPRGVPAVRLDPSAASSSCWWTMGAWTARGRCSSDPRGRACGGDAAALAAPRQGGGRAGRHSRRARAGRRARRVLRRRPLDAARARSTISWPCSATAPGRRVRPRLARDADGP